MACGSEGGARRGPAPLRVRGQQHPRWTIVPVAHHRRAGQGQSLRLRASASPRILRCANIWGGGLARLGGPWLAGGGGSVCRSACYGPVQRGGTGGISPWCPCTTLAARSGFCGGGRRQGCLVCPTP